MKKRLDQRKKNDPSLVVLPSNEKNKGRSLPVLLAQTSTTSQQSSSLESKATTQVQGKASIKAPTDPEKLKKV
jgi:hypothetical protein